MASPDLRTYTDLTLYDRSPAELVERALLDATSKFPDWTPREGNTEVVLIEALALEVAELVYAINRVPGAVVEVLLRLLGVTRSEGAAATATATFALADTAGHTIPAATTVRLDLGDGSSALFATTVDLVVPPASSSGTVAIVALDANAAANGTPAATVLALVDVVNYVNTVTLATAVAGGTDVEDVTAWLNRGVERLSRLSDSLILPEHFTSAALEDVRVGRATTVDNTDPGVGPAGANPGNVLVIVADVSGGALAGGVMIELEASFEARSAAMLNVHVAAPTITTVPVTATVRRLPGYASGDVQTAVAAALAAYLDPASWPWAGTVRRNELIALLDRVDGVDYVETLTAPATDVTLTGYGPLADAGTLTITVNAP